MEAFSALLTLCEGNPPVIGGVMRIFVVFFGVSPTCWTNSLVSGDLWRHETQVTSFYNDDHDNNSDIEDFEYNKGFDTNIWRFKQISGHFADNIFKCIFCIKIFVTFLFNMASLGHNEIIRYRADSRLVLSQWETSLQSNVVSHWLGANLESAPR